MAKRFIDTEIFKKRFFRGLQGPYKLLWNYIFLDCNHAGVWISDFQIANIYVGPWRKKIEEQEALTIFNKDKIRVIPFNRGKWFLPGFIKFQYGSLNPKNRAHMSVIQILENENLLSTYFELMDGQYFLQKEKIEKMEENQIKPLVSPLEGAKDKDKDLDKDLDKDKGKGKFKKPCVETLTLKFQEKGIMGGAGKFMAEKFFNHYESNGWMVGKNKMKSWPASVAGWVARNKERNQKPKQKESMTQQVDDMEDCFEQEE